METKISKGSTSHFFHSFCPISTQLQYGFSQAGGGGGYKPLPLRAKDFLYCEILLTYTHNRLQISTPPHPYSPPTAFRLEYWIICGNTDSASCFSWQLTLKFGNGRRWGNSKIWNIWRTADRRVNRMKNLGAGV